MWSQRGESAESKLNENTYDLEAWNVLIKENQLKTIEEARTFYERLVERFPVTGRFWKIKTRNYEKAEKLFQRSLTKVLHIELWKLYLTYVKETKGSLPSFREKMAKAYDFALENIGMDNLSYTIWNDYVTFLKNVDAAGSYAENQKITAVRKVYQRGVVNPMVKIQEFWTDYSSYEHSINQIIAEKMTADRSRDYMNARRVAKEYEIVTRGLNRNGPSVPPLSDGEQSRQVELWRKYITWEKSNPLRYEDAAEVVRRVEFAYEQCLLCLAHYPDIWFEYATFLEESAKKQDGGGKYLDDAASVYERATSGILKGNILLHFSWADFEEGRNKKDKAAKIYLDLLDIKEIDPTLVYVQYMKFARRAEGVTRARTIFKRAREDPRSGHQIYSAAALMEYYCLKDKNVACKIFELGLKKFTSEQGYILSYLDFLGHQNEENNTRVLFERVLTSSLLSVEDSLEIWNKFLEFESNIGDLSSITKVEKRRAAAVEKLAKAAPETAWLVDRYRFLDLYPCSPQELKAIGYTTTKSALGASNGSGPAPVAKNGEEDYTRPAVRPIATPNFSQMIPFKPSKDAKTAYGSHRVAGGIFPPPPAVGSLMAMLPHPQCFRGPFVNVIELINIFATAGLQQNGKGPKAEGIPNGLKLFETAAKASANFAQATGTGSHESSERAGHSNNKRLQLDDDDGDQMGDNSNSNNAPAFDIYRHRQMNMKKSRPT